MLVRSVKIGVFDQQGTENAREILADTVTYARDNYVVLEVTDGLAIIIKWYMFKITGTQHIKSPLKRPVVFDARNIYNPGDMRAHGFTYFGIGRK